MDALILDVGCTSSTSFGSSRRRAAREFSSRALQTLQGAADESELRIAVASWRRHSNADLVALAAADGCFAYSGLTTEPTEAELDAVLTEARRTKPHVLVFPELAFSKRGSDSSPRS